MKRIDDAVQRLLERFTLSEVLGALGRWMADGAEEELHPFGETLKALAGTPPVLRCAGALPKDGMLRPEPWADLANTGLLFEINRTVLHPLGLALRVTQYDAEEGGGFEFDGLVSVPDPEGIIFDAASLMGGANKLATFLRDIGNERLMARREALGYDVQPAPTVLFVNAGELAGRFAEMKLGDGWGPASRTKSTPAPPAKMLRCLGKEVPLPEGWTVVYRDRVNDDDPFIENFDRDHPPLPPGWSPPVWVAARDGWQSRYIGTGEAPESKTGAPASGMGESASPVEHERWPAHEASFDGVRFRYRRSKTRSYSVTGSRIFAEFDVCTQTQDGAKWVDALRSRAGTGTVGWLATRCGDSEARCGWATICQWPADTKAAPDGEDASFTFEIHADEQTAREHSRHRHGYQGDGAPEATAPTLHTWLRGLLDLMSGFYKAPLPAAELNRKMAALDDGLRTMEQRAERLASAVAADVARMVDKVTHAAAVASPQPVEIGDRAADLAKTSAVVSVEPARPAPEQPIVPGTNNVRVPERWHLAPVFPGDRPAIHYFGTKAPMLGADWTTPVSGGLAGLWVSFYTGTRSGTHSGEALLQDATHWAGRPPTPRDDTPPSPHHAENDHVGEVVRADLLEPRPGERETTGGESLLDCASTKEPAPSDPPAVLSAEYPEPGPHRRTRLQGTVNEQTVTFVNPHFGDGYLLANIEADPLNWRSGAMVTLHIPARMAKPRECVMHPKGGFWVFTWMPEKIVSLGIATKGVKAGEMVALETTNVQVSPPKGERIVLRYGDHMADAWLDRVTTKSNTPGTPERLYRIVVTLIDGPRSVAMMDLMRADQGGFAHDLSIRPVREYNAIGPILARAVVWPGRESTSRTVTFLESPNDLTSEAERLRAWLAEREERPVAKAETAPKGDHHHVLTEPVPLMRQAPYIALADLETRVSRAVLIRCLEWGIEHKLSNDLPQVQTLCEDASQQFDAQLRAHGGNAENIPPAVIKRLVADFALLILQTRNPNALATRSMAQIDAEIATMVKATRSAKVSGGLKSLLDLAQDARVDAQHDSEPPDSYDGVPDSTPS